MTASELAIFVAKESILYVLLAAAALKRGNQRERVAGTLSRRPGARLDQHNLTTAPGSP